MKQVRSNLTGICNEMPVNYQVSADNGYFTDEITEYLDKHGFDGYISSQKHLRKRIKICPKNHFPKTISNMIMK